jgi:hypothetical protein
MISLLFHSIGLCPDHFDHLNLSNLSNIPLVDIVNNYGVVVAKIKSKFKK